MTLKNKVAFITGAASGMGQAQAKLFAEKGAKIVALDLDTDGLNELKDELKKKGSEVLTLETDMTDEAAVQKAVDDVIKHFGQIDILSNTAGVLDDFTPATETSKDLWDKTIAVNLTGPFILAKAVIPHMVDKGKGNIINLASIAGFVAGGGGAAYTSSKHGIIGLTKQLSLDYGQKGIRVNAIAPGFIETAMTADVDSSLVNDTPAKRAAKPEEVAKLALFLASDDSDFIHGETVKIDGGWTVD